jgi:hypothetical protein
VLLLSRWALFRFVCYFLFFLHFFSFQPLTIDQYHVNTPHYSGHCKTMKPGFAEAAADTKDLNIPLVAMDCTVNEKTCKLYDVTGRLGFNHARFCVLLAFTAKHSFHSFLFCFFVY